MILKDEVQERIELLAIMAEECGELTQECMKIIRFGQDNENLTKEAGDVMCMIQLLIEKDLVNQKQKLSDLKSPIENLSKETLKITMYNINKFLLNEAI